jgi:hypothetical protein
MLATLRARAERQHWHRVNKLARHAGCRCGEPATHVAAVGPAQNWTCYEHRGAAMWITGINPGQIPVYEHRWPCPDSCPGIHLYETGPARWYCTNRDDLTIVRRVGA